jgi:hypothetical protein
METLYYVFNKDTIINQTARKLVWFFYATNSRNPYSYLYYLSTPRQLFAIFTFTSPLCKKVVTWRGKNNRCTMTIENSFLYSIKESVKITNIPARTLSREALKNNNRKIDGCYLFTGSQLKALIEKRLKKEKHLANRSPTSRQNKNTATLKGTGEVVSKEQYDALKTEIEALKEELSQYDIEDNERIEVFTNEMYAEFEQRLNDWKLQNQKIKSQQELFDAKEKGLNDVVNLMTEQSEHYKNQFQYQKEQATRILDMHEKLLDTIQLNGKEGFIKSVVEAKKTDWKKE